jgi:hypothetical protein
MKEELWIQNEIGIIDTSEIGIIDTSEIGIVDITWNNKPVTHNPVGLMYEG